MGTGPAEIYSMSRCAPGAGAIVAKRQAQKSRPSLADLPPPVLSEVLSFLSAADVIRAERTCRAIRSCSDRSFMLWIGLCERITRRPVNLGKVFIAELVPWRLVVLRFLQHRRRKQMEYEQKLVRKYPRFHFSEGCKAQLLDPATLLIPCPFGRCESSFFSADEALERHLWEHVGMTPVTCPRCHASLCRRPAGDAATVGITAGRTEEIFRHVQICGGATCQEAELLPEEEDGVPQDGLLAHGKRRRLYAKPMLLPPGDQCNGAVQEERRPTSDGLHSTLSLSVDAGDLLGPRRQSSC